MRPAVGFLCLSFIIDEAANYDHGSFLDKKNYKRNLFPNKLKTQN